MPTRPEVRTLTNTSVDVLNAIRNSASINYRDYVPYATPDADSIREIGAVIMDYPALQNEFLNALINRIGRVILSSKMYSNPWEMFKKGTLEFGETIEDIFVDIAKPFKYDVAVAESEVFKREIPDVRSAFYIMNYQTFYKTTIQQEQLRLAFLSWTGITDLIAKIVDSMYSAANYDEFQVMKYMIAKRMLDGEVKRRKINDPTSANIKGDISTIKSVSNYMEFMTRDYNLAGVANFSPKKSQYLICTADYDAVVDVEVLAMAFNMDKAEFLGHKVLIDSFANLDWDRLDLLFDGVEGYRHFYTTEITGLKKVHALIVDEDWFMIYDNLYNFTENYNGQGLYWNYFYHVWKTFAISPFANAVMFDSTSSNETSPISFTVSPATADIVPGTTLQMVANRTNPTGSAANFNPHTVEWSITGDPIDGVSIDARGILTVGPDVEVGTTISVHAQSTISTSSYGDATITVVSGE